VPVNTHMKLPVKHYVRTADGRWRENLKRQDRFELDTNTVTFLQQWSCQATPWQINTSKEPDGRNSLALVARR
jgi:hypothetical protein